MAQRGILSEGKHYRRGWAPKASWSWEVEAIHRTLLARSAPDRALREVAS
ncbi:hypothetical protein [Synechococcus sp. RSCCF101]|nr:hypothetical protein [Synechococcus sp. RSCCF101]